MRGGKRLRPIVAAAAYRAAKGPGPVEPTVDVGASLELLQTYLLIHDDWMDEDDERRGGPAVHYAFQKKPRTMRTSARASAFSRGTSHRRSAGSSSLASVPSRRPEAVR